MLTQPLEIKTVLRMFRFGDGTFLLYASPGETVRRRFLITYKLVGLTSPGYNLLKEISSVVFVEKYFQQADVYGNNVGRRSFIFFSGRQTGGSKKLVEEICWAENLMQNNLNVTDIGAQI